MSTHLRGLIGSLLLVTSTLAVGCASPSSPSLVRPTGAGAGDAPASHMVTLTVRVVARAVETPLPGAVVRTDDGTVQADANGTCQLAVRSGATANVDVSAAGYVPLGASGVLASDERWTFYLEPVTGTTSSLAGGSTVSAGGPTN